MYRLLYLISLLVLFAAAPVHAASVEMKKTEKETDVIYRHLEKCADARKNEGDDYFYKEFLASLNKSKKSFQAYEKDQCSMAAVSAEMGSIGADDERNCQLNLAKDRKKHMEAIEQLYCGSERE